jgi:L,D-transpeptidase catalytic domain
LSFLLLPYKQIHSTNGKYPTVNLSFTKNFVIRDSSSVLTITDEGTFLYDSLQLGKAGLSKEAFDFAWKGYNTLIEKNYIHRKGVLTICDFSQSSRKKRMYLIDVENYKLLLQTYVAHGRNSGNEFAAKFSNRPESLQSSLGFYITRSTYYGSHGLALKIDGIESGINDKAERRKIVVHGSEYVGSNYLHFSKYMGRSFGCPAVPATQSKTIINTIKDGTCFFIYHPSKTYKEASKILNG